METFAQEQQALQAQYKNIDAEYTRLLQQEMSTYRDSLAEQDEFVKEVLSLLETFL